MAKLNYEFTEGIGGGSRPSWLLILNGGICKGYNKEAFSKQAALEHSEAVVKNDMETFGEKNVTFTNSIKDTEDSKGMTTIIKLIENKEKKHFEVHVNGVREYHPFKAEVHAKAKAFDECCKAIVRRERILVSYESF